MSNQINTVTLAVKEFKKKYYLAALVARGFNVAKTARELGASRGDLYNHVGRSKKNLIAQAKYLNLL